MKTSNTNLKMLMVSSYPPRECGIASFCYDMVDAISQIFGESLPIEICALQNNDEPIAYGEEVSYVLNTTQPNQYQKIVDDINERSDVGMIGIQHEFGLYGGEYGNDLLPFMLAVNKPIAIILHTVLPGLDKKRAKVMHAIADLSDAIIVLTNQSKKLLIDQNICNADKIYVIPHGTHIVLWKDKARLKKKHGFENHTILSTFGLLSENKGIETILYALPKVIKTHPTVVYLILGKTHPEVLKRDGEQYRNKLNAITSSLKIQGHVKFINEYLPLNTLLEYLNISDLYLFSSKDPYQAVSGTFAYAQSAGCPVICTPIPHAVEMIDDGTGVLLDEFENPEKFEIAIMDLLDNKEKRTKLGKSALSKTRAFCWENAAIAYATIFGKLTNKSEDLDYVLPAFDLSHIRELTTAFGIIQFSDFSQPDLDSGYTLDDNARALIAMVTHYNQNKDSSVLALANRYLNFIEFVQKDNGWFENYVDINQQITSQNNQVNLEDANGRAMWALGYTLSQQNILPKSLTTTAEYCWEKAIPSIEKVTSPRAISFALKGLYHYHSFYKDEKTVQLAKILVERLMHCYQLTTEPEWCWYEDYLTYANSVLPEAMMFAYLIIGEESYRKIAIVTFDFLLSNYFMKGQIKVISNRGWFHKRNERNFFGEQPIEIAYTILALDLFYQVTKKRKYKDQLKIAFSWFMGNNHLCQVMYNPANGAGYDGLEQTHVNINQGAESTLCYLLARQVIEKYVPIKSEPVCDKRNPVSPLVSKFITKSLHKPAMMVNQTLLK